MDAKLVIVGGKANKSEVDLKLPTIIGRSRDADLTMAHPMVSRQHCEIFEVNGLLKLRDLGSLNGTLANNQKVTEVDLPPNAKFTIGPLTFEVKYDYVGEIASAPQAAAASGDVDVPEVEFVEELADFEDFSEDQDDDFDTEDLASLAIDPDDLPLDMPADDDQPLEMPADKPEPEEPAAAAEGDDLPDFAAWADADVEEDEIEDAVDKASDKAAGAPLSGPALSSPSPAATSEEPTVQFDKAELEAAKRASNKAGSPRNAGEDEPLEIDFAEDKPSKDASSDTAGEDDLTEFLKGLE